MKILILKEKTCMAIPWNDKQMKELNRQGKHFLFEVKQELMNEMKEEKEYSSWNMKEIS